MRKRIIEAFGDYNKPNRQEIDEFVKITSAKENEFGYLGHSVHSKDNFLLFHFQKDIREIVRWGVKSVTDGFLESYSNIESGFVSKIKGMDYPGIRADDQSYYLPIEFSILKGKTPILILHLSSIIKGEVDKTIKITDYVDKDIFDALEPICAWVKLCQKIYDLNKLDMDVINDLFSDAFDDAEDYAIATIGRLHPIKAYEIAISTKTIKDGGFIDIDSDVSNLLKDIPNIVGHLEEYNVTVSFNTSKPSKDRFPDKNDTFYKSQALIIRILPSVGAR